MVVTKPDGDEGEPPLDPRVMEDGCDLRFASQPSRRAAGGIRQARRPSLASLCLRTYGSKGMVLDARYSP